MLHSPPLALSSSSKHSSQCSHTATGHTKEPHSQQSLHQVTLRPTHNTPPPPCSREESNTPESVRKNLKITARSGRELGSPNWKPTARPTALSRCTYVLKATYTIQESAAHHCIHPLTGRQLSSNAGSEPAGMADSSSLEQLFIVEPDFCPSCGAILALPVSGQAIKCKVCHFSISVDVLLGHTTSSTYEFNPLGVYSSSKKLPEGGDEEEGQRDPHRECSRCGHMGMTYTTMQLRSADEGQTIFYMCPKCRHREVENS